MIVLYTMLMSVILVIVYPVAWVSALFGQTYLLKRLHVPANIQSDETKRVWIHAASVGEARIAFSMTCEIKRKYPLAHIFISTSTSTGLARVRALNDNEGEGPVENAFLAPFDHPVITGNFIKKIKPTSFILVETELWPWLIRSIYRKCIPITIINGKLSKQAFRRYFFVHSAIGKILKNISLICVQSRTFAKRYRMLDVPEERIEIIGNVKFDGLPGAADYDTGQFRLAFGIPERVKVFVAGSTRRGEEEELARSFKRVLKRYSDAVMVLAPRHLNRVSEVGKIVSDAGLLYARRSAGEKLIDSEKRVLILDTLGELIKAFACADVAFVGGSLRDFGGHNPLEPAALGIPVLFGPYMEQTGSKELLSEGAAILVHGSDELTEAVNEIFESVEKRRLMSMAGPAVVKRFKGTLARTLKCMENRRVI